MHGSHFSPHDHTHLSALHQLLCAHKRTNTLAVHPHSRHSCSSRRPAALTHHQSVHLTPQWPSKPPSETCTGEKAPNDLPFGTPSSLHRASTAPTTASRCSCDLPAATGALRRRLVAAQHQFEHLNQLRQARSTDTTLLLRGVAPLTGVGRRRSRAGWRV